MMRSWQQKSEGRGGRFVGADWEPGVGSAETHVSGPVRSIAITPAMLEAEQRRSQAHPVSADASAWRAHIFAGRQQPVPKAPAAEASADYRTRDIRNSAVFKSSRPCKEQFCGRPTKNASGICRKCKFRAHKAHLRKIKLRRAELQADPAHWRSTDAA